MSKDRGEIPPVGPEAASAPPPVDREQLISNAPFHPATDSPRTKQAKDSVNKLEQLKSWDGLQFYHSKLCTPDHSGFAFNATHFADYIWASQTELKDIIPDFNSMTDKLCLEMGVRNVYSNLAAEITANRTVDEGGTIACACSRCRFPDHPYAKPTRPRCQLSFLSRIWT
ncbi:uncharacterized protein UMAG_11188 [Mycosarcoma maydis]|uniref:Uncharacterized protein n=1 Tax=Mycosarcoma maydis TaxID=5270 RepID=A0A0D1BVQ2_MYCMD|nr:uncharacterized protein UMAG_11188 [Ustilago maydis 521]KIS66072.1 hypothetical protein UMAG_11188 [Ustilago maydis 521]|eukprot:XP_011392331.1 hypothetical protein UMAG_11188 [Ustilago maydis 521]